MGSLALLLIRFWQAVPSPLLGPRCRFHPTCSEYARQAVGRRGLAKALPLVARRLAKCHPFHPGGLDPVP